MCVCEQFLHLSFSLLMLIRSHSLSSTPRSGVRYLFLSSCFTAEHRNWAKSPTGILKERTRILSAMKLCSNFSSLFYLFRASAEAPPGILLRQGSGKTSAAAVQPLRPPWWRSRCAVPTGPWCSTTSPPPRCANAVLGSAHHEYCPEAQLLNLKLYDGRSSRCKPHFLCTLPYPLESWIIVSTQQTIKLTSMTEHSLIHLGVDCRREVAGCIDPLHFTVEINPHHWRNNHK